jgi:hypothetical protein
MSFVEFFWALDSARLRDEVEWRQTREVVAMIYNTNSKKTKKGKDLIPLSIDAPLLVKKIKRMTATEFKKLVESKGKKVWQQ